MRLGATRGVVLGWLVILMGATVGAKQLSDNSYLTHLTTGRLILKGHLPTTDPYTFSAHGHPWVVQSWLASLLYALTDKVGHGMGSRIMISLLCAILAGLLWRLSRPASSILIRTVSVAPALLVGAITWGERPMIFGFVAFAVVLVFLREERDPRWLVPIMWVWVNTHGSFPLGLVLIVAYGIGVYFDGGKPDHAVRTFVWCAGGTLLGAINPLGPKLLWFPVALLAKQKTLHQMIEWQAPQFQSTWQRIFLVSLFFAVALVPKLGTRVRYQLLLPALVFVVLGLTAQRNIALATFLLVPLLASELAGLGSLSSKVRAKAYTLASCAVIGLMALAVGARLAKPAYDLSPYPVNAMDWLQSQGRLGSQHRIAAPDYVGNYLEFRTTGKTLVFVDDRVDMFPPDVIAAENVLLGGKPGWSKALAGQHVDTVVWRANLPLAALLNLSPDWDRVRTFQVRGADAPWNVYEKVNP